MTGECGSTTERVVETWAKTTKSRGSGYLISGRVILTAAHCVPKQVNAEVNVRRLNEADWRRAYVKWWGRDPSVDAALLEFDADEEGTDPYGLGDGLVRFAKPISEVGWSAVGFPWADERDGVTEPEQTKGQLDPTTNSKNVPETQRRGLYALLTDVELRLRPDLQSAWAGMSGAAVLVKGNVVGMVVEDAPRFERRLLGVPIEWVLSDSDAVKALCPDLGQVPLRSVWNDSSLLESAVRPFASRLGDGGRVSRAVMLQARRRAVDRVGRDRDLAELLRWCTAQGDVGGVQLITGGGGSGKTRLGVELCAELESKGWVCGFLAPLAKDFRPLCDLDANRLVVLDDAIGHLDQLDALLHDADNAARNPESGNAWRVMVLARNAGPWWSRLASTFPNVITSEPYVLEPPSLDERQRLYRGARERFGRRLDPPEPTKSPLPDLADPVFDNFAAIVERALLDADPAAAATLNRDLDMSGRTLCLEANAYWQPDAEASGLRLDLKLLERVVALCSLVIVDCPTTSECEKEAAWWLRVLPDLSDASEQTRRRVVRWAHSLYQTRDSYLPELRPHHLATAAATNLVRDCPEVLTQLLDCSHGSADKTPLEHLERAVAQAVRVLSTLLPQPAAGNGHQQLPSDVADILHRVVENNLLGLVKLTIQHANRPTPPNPTGKALSLETILAEMLRLRLVVPSPDLAAGVADLLPSSTNLRLDHLALVMQEQAIIHYRTEADIAIERLAYALKKLSVKQLDLGDLEKAKDSANQGVDLLAKLLESPAAAPPAAVKRRRMKLASARASLANILCGLNARSAAVEQAEQANGLLTEVMPLLEDDVQTGHIQIAVLSNLSKALRHAGRGKEACDVSGQAEALAEELYRRKPKKYHDWYAIALRRHSAALGDIGFATEAVEKAGMAVKHFDVMVAHKPARWAYDKAVAHRNYAERLADVGRWEDADKEAKSAVNDWNELASRRAGAYDSELAKAQIILARAQLKTDCPNETAAQTICAAVTQLAPLASGPATDHAVGGSTKDSSAGPDDILASALAVNAEVNYELSRSATELAQRSVDALRSLRQTEESNRLLTCQLARSLYILAGCTRATDPASAEAQSDEATQLSQEMDNDDCRPPGILQEARSFWQRVSNAG